MRGAVIIHPFAAADEAGLYALAPPDHGALVARAIASHRRGDNVILVAVDAGGVVGQVWLDVARRRHEGVAVLWALRVAEQRRGDGIGGLLVDAAERVAAERHFARIALGVIDDNRALVAMYERRGYRVVGTHVDCEHWRTADGGVRRAVFAQLVLEKEILHGAPGPSLDHW